MSGLGLALAQGYVLNEALALALAQGYVLNEVIAGMSVWLCSMRR